MHHRRLPQLALGGARESYLFRIANTRENFRERCYSYFWVYASRSKQIRSLCISFSVKQQCMIPFVLCTC